MVAILSRLAILKSPPSVEKGPSRILPRFRTFPFWFSGFSSDPRCEHEFGSRASGAVPRAPCAATAYLRPSVLIAPAPPTATLASGSLARAAAVSRTRRRQDALVTTMSSISAQGVVERASAELSKRINGLGLRGSKHHSAKGSVMERVTNVFCGGGAAAPEKPSRLAARARPGPAAAAAQRRPRPPPQYLSWEQLMLDEKFLGKFFMYFSACERCVLARVCTRWRDVLYRSPRYGAPRGNALLRFLTSDKGKQMTFGGEL